MASVASVLTPPRSPISRPARWASITSGRDADADDHRVGGNASAVLGHDRGDAARRALEALDVLAAVDLDAVVVRTFWK